MLTCVETGRRLLRYPLGDHDRGLVEQRREGEDADGAEVAENAWVLGSQSDVRYIPLAARTYVGLFLIL